MTAAALKLSAVLWVVWGAVHAFACGMIISGDTASGFQAIADAVPPQIMSLDYPEAVGGILNQHAWNLLWDGLGTIIGAIFIWRGNLTAIRRASSALLCWPRSTRSAGGRRTSAHRLER